MLHYRLIHGFTCAGVLPTQYINFAMFSGIGRVGHDYIRQGNCHAYNMLVCYENSILFSVQSPWVHWHSGSFGGAIDAESSGRGADPPRLYNKGRGNQVFNVHV